MNAIDTTEKRNIKTRIHTYYFNINEPAQARQYDELCARLNAQGYHQHESWGGGSHYSFIADRGLSGQEVTLETTHLFNDQWNTADGCGSDKGLRVFDWAQDAAVLIPAHYKRGHYLEITDEMRAFRADWMECNYCGHQYHKTKAPKFCDKCLDSEYLEKKDLHLLRLTPIGTKWQKDKELAKLTEEESAELLPRFIEAQTERGKARIAKKRADIIEEAESTIKDATTKRDGFLWLMDRGINVDNCIFYNHTQRFSFGWRKPVEKEIESAILEHMSEFPFLYEIKCADGRTLNNEE